MPKTKTRKITLKTLVLTLALTTNANGVGHSIDDYLPLAEKGDVEAQEMLGYLYSKEISKELFGLLNAAAMKEAIKWYAEAAEQGSTKARFSLGQMHRVGAKIPQNDTEAFKWFHMAATLGHAGAQNQLGQMYLAGEGTAKNEKEATRWLYAAARQGHHEAMFMLALCYRDGVGVKTGRMEAYAWLNLAAARGNGNAVTEKSKLGKTMTLDQRTRAQELSWEYWKKYILLSSDRQGSR